MFTTSSAISGQFLLRMRRNFNKTTSGLQFHARFEFAMPVFLYGENFKNRTTISGTFSQFSAAHAQKRPEFHFRSNFLSIPWLEIPIGYFLFYYEFWWRLLRDLCVFWAKANDLCNAQFSEFGAIGVGVTISDETPKWHILDWFHAVRDIIRGDPMRVSHFHFYENLV